jgi:GR25 family glycosyltransferase involved in LPS biosynthesis
MPHRSRSSEAAAPTVFVINLDRAQDRMAAIQKQLDVAGITYVRVSAIDGATMAPDSAAALSGARIGTPQGRALEPGEAACYASHLMVLRYVVAEGLPDACIVEDNIELVGDLRSALIGLRKLNPIRAVVKLEGLRDGRRNHGVVIHRIAGADLVAPLRTTVGAAAYYVSASGARALLKLCREMTAPMTWRTPIGIGCEPICWSFDRFRCVRSEGRLATSGRINATARQIRRPSGRSLLNELIYEVTLPARRLGRWVKNRRTALSSAIAVTRSLGLKDARLRWRVL